ncbi:uncharacterized protein I206_105473 [Kwoniella pini CBS 10737]|uniref:Cytoplasmic protein n=1 Tax=Kwoniella pini CBS 10737 TaxID=1296096 RepID=A0AAJ8L9B7_9TREE
MFVLKSLLGKMWGNPANPELMQIPAGQLYLVRPNSIKGSRECIFPDAVATIRRTGVEYQYQLVVTRAYDEGEEQLLDEDAETDDERVFLIDHALGFRFGTLDGDSTCAWRDLSGDDGDLWEFVSSRATNGLFELTLLHCVFERVSHSLSTPVLIMQKHGRSHEDATDTELEALKFNDESVSDQKSVAPATPKKEKTLPEAAVAEDPFKDVPILHRSSAELYLFDLETEVFVIQEKEVYADLASNGEYDTWIIVRHNSTPFISAPIDAEMNPRFDMVNHAFMFTFRETEGLPGMTWCLRFDEKVFEQWKDKFTIFMWEGKNRTSYAKAKADEQRYIQEAYEDVEMAEPDEEDHRAESDEEEEEADRSSADEPDEYQSESEESEADAFERGSKNQQLAVGYKNDVSFVARGDMIGVFAHQDDKLRFRTAIDRVKNLEGKTFSPKKMMLHNQDGDMLLLDPSNQNSVYRMDLEYGKVVDEWKVSDSVEVNNIIPDSKYAQMNPQQTFIGHSHNGLFRIDPRVSGNKLVESQFKQYATKNDFSAATTTESGKLAVASNKGDIRLFDQIGKNAKTALPALGDPIIGVDVSADGRWLVATCKTYLLLIDTLIGDGRYKGSLGFDRSFPADSKPIPRRLQLKPEHVAYMEDPVSFTPARFNTGVNEAEKTIVTSTGKYVIKQYDSRVVADNFKFGADKNIIVALEHNVVMANKRELAKPTRSSLAPRTSLATPVRKIRQSHSDIVNSPY